MRLNVNKLIRSLLPIMTSLFLILVYQNCGGPLPEGSLDSNSSQNNDSSQSSETNASRTPSHLQDYRNGTGGTNNSESGSNSSENNDNSSESGTSGKLVNGKHTALDCGEFQGVVVTDVSGNPFCRLSLKKCPTGWSQYENWSSTTPTMTKGYRVQIRYRTDSESNNTNPYCVKATSKYNCYQVTGYHMWNNKAVETALCGEKHNLTNGGDECNGQVVNYSEIYEIGCF